MKKRILTAVLAIALIFTLPVAFTGCGSSEEKSKPKETKKEEEQEASCEENLKLTGMLGKTADEVMKKYKFSEHYSKVGKFNFFEFKDGNNSLFFGFDTNASELKGNEKCRAILADFTKIFTLAKEVYRLSSDNLAYMLGAKKASIFNDAKLKKALDEKRRETGSRWLLRPRTTILKRMRSQWCLNSRSRIWNRSYFALKRRI